MTSPKRVLRSRPERLGALLAICSSAPYQALQRVIAWQRFELKSAAGFPRANLFPDKNKVECVEIRPHRPKEDASLHPDQLEKLANEMGFVSDELWDGDVDTLDALFCLFLESASAHTDHVRIYVDDILKARRLQPRRGGAGRRGGYTPAQRKAVVLSLHRLDKLWLHVFEPPRPGKKKREFISSKAFALITTKGLEEHDERQVLSVVVTMGEVFGNVLFGAHGLGRQIMLLSARALQYHQLNQAMEKRLLRYLAWQWRIGASRGDLVRRFRLSTLVYAIGLLPEEEAFRPKKPNRVCERLEKCLNELHRQGDIAEWQYAPGWSEVKLPDKRWLVLWLDACVDIEAPQEIRDAFKSLDKALPPASLKARLSSAATWPERLREARGSLSQMRAAEEMKISQALFSYLERGVKQPTRKVIALFEAWIGGDK